VQNFETEYIAKKSVRIDKVRLGKVIDEHRGVEGGGRHLMYPL
jgi:hypothetical protein